LTRFFQVFVCVCVCVCNCRVVQRQFSGRQARRLTCLSQRPAQLVSRKITWAAAATSTTHQTASLAVAHRCFMPSSAWWRSSRAESSTRMIRSLALPSTTRCTASLSITRTGWCTRASLDCDCSSSLTELALTSVPVRHFNGQRQMLPFNSYWQMTVRLWSGIYGSRCHNVVFL